MDPTARDDAAERLAASRRGGERLRALPREARPRDIAEAYAVQEALHGRLTGELGALAGHKIGCTTAVMQRFLGIDHPCAGGVFATTVVEGRARLRRGAYHRVGLECEIAVELCEDLAAAAAPFDRDRVAGAVRAVMAAVEIVDERFVDFREVGAPSLIADDFFNAGAVLGERLVDWRGLDLAAVEGRVAVDGREIGRGLGRDVLGHPLEALVWLADHSAARGRSLAAGAFVLLGSVVQTYWPAAGERIEVTLEGLGRLVVEID